MIRREKYSSWWASGIRTRYFPKSRIGSGLISIAPWLNVVLLMIFFLLIDRKYVLEPGVVIELPKAPIEGGSPFGLTAVILSIKGTEKGEREEIVFFDDVRYRLKQEEQRRRLQRAFAGHLREGQEVTLVIQADRGVSHGIVVDLMNMAMAAGIDKVNIAARP
jgi:biopolymer transport protein ExbD